MSSALRSLRRRVLTPNVSETKLANRGFHVKSREARASLENIGETFLTGFAAAVEARTVADAEERLEQLPAAMRGFAYEGAGMGFGVLDAMPFTSGRKNAEFIAGRGAAHVYMVYVGIGWAMARLPRFRWPKSEGLDPLLIGLVHDGYGFHQAYFHTRKYVHEHYQAPRFPWPAHDPSGYNNRAVDHGIGRALWFVGGSDVDRVSTLVERFPAARHGDLWAGVGLAATYAGGAGDAELHELLDRAGVHRPQLAQGSSFAAEARIRAGLLVPHNERATRILCGMNPQDAARVSQENLPDGPFTGDLRAFQIWRQLIADQFVSIGGVTS
ncbi:DUF1702 family protein [Rhizohabitans arisaemae]|uniref:DUF1702 family protein n=1 Tax=Rhizohabitans arisaemae TaxID=2720610 RepID=UPI0024B0DDD8|nr:DUF1702 family protein [Rhizohabitans arisaemae]